MAESCGCFTEVSRLHSFFADWFHGALDEDEFETCEQALAPGFRIVTPGGDLIERSEILAAIRRHHGREPAEFDIVTVGRSCRQVDGVHLATYEERHTGPRSTIRLSTAALTSEEDQWRWHSVHETWITV